MNKSSKRVAKSAPKELRQLKSDRVVVTNEGRLRKLREAESQKGQTYGTSSLSICIPLSVEIPTQSP